MNVAGTKKAARAAAHKHFDHIWKSGRMGYKEAYAWLASQMEKVLGECHMSLMSAKECRKVVWICKQLEKYDEKQREVTQGGNRGELCR